MNKRSIAKTEKMKEMIRLKALGNSLKEISKILNLSVSSLYKYQEQLALQNIDVILEKLFISIKTNNSIFESVNSLTFSEISTISRKYKLYGISRKDKIMSIVKSIGSYVTLGMKPYEILTRSKLKTQYFKRAKEVHPDINKTIDNAVFIALHNAYENLQSQVIF